MVSKWRVYCLRNSTLKQLYFDCSDDVQSDLRAHEERLAGRLQHWDFSKHDLMCFDLDEHADEDTAAAGVGKLRAAPAPAGWNVVT